MRKAKKTTEKRPSGLFFCLRDCECLKKTLTLQCILFCMHLITNSNLFNYETKDHEAVFSPEEDTS